MGTLSEWQAKATRERASVGVPLNRVLLEQFEEAEKELEQATRHLEQAERREDAPRGEGRSSRMLGTPDEARARVEQLEARVEELRKDVDAGRVTLVFETVERRRWLELLAQHPATEEQKEQYEAVPGVVAINELTFYPAAMVESCVEPGDLDEDAFVWLQNFLPLGEWNRVLASVNKVNLVGGRDPFENGSVVAQRSVSR
jgi:hypothetical protein